jgi:hypothetical protein
MKMPDFDITNKVRALWNSPHRLWVLGGVAVIMYMNMTGTTISGKAQPAKAKATVSGKKKPVIQTNTSVEQHAANVPRLAGGAARVGSSSASVQLGDGARTAPAILLINGYTSDTPSLSDQYAPYGRVVKCKLQNTIESNNTDTPIRAIVIEELNHDGVRIFTPGIVEMHGWIQTSGVRDRINSQRSWIAVWTSKAGDEDNGKEMVFTGVALDYAPIPDEPGKWSMTDGSAGLKGWTIDTTDMEKLLAIAARFIEGAGQGLTSSTVFQTAGGNETVYDGTLKSGAAQGFSYAAQTLAQSMLEEIRKRGVYVRVPAGQTFYIYVTQPLDLANARVGASRFANGKGTGKIN